MSPRSAHFRFYLIGRVTTYFTFAVGVFAVLITLFVVPTLGAPLPETAYLGALLIPVAALAYAAVSATIWSFPPVSPRTFTMRRLLLLLMFIVLLTGGALFVLGLLPIGFTGTDRLFILAAFGVAGTLMIINQIAWATYQRRITAAVLRKRGIARAAGRRRS
jgi:hypothetical protein